MCGQGLAGRERGPTVLTGGEKLLGLEMGKAVVQRQGGLQSGHAGFRGTLWSLGEEENIYLGVS